MQFHEKKNRFIWFHEFFWPSIYYKKIFGEISRKFFMKSNKFKIFFREIAILAVLNFFPSSKIDFWPILKWQKMEFGQNKISWNWFIWFHGFFLPWTFSNFLAHCESVDKTSSIMEPGPPCFLRTRKIFFFEANLPIEYQQTILLNLYTNKPHVLLEYVT